jgi:hypothetical protein
MVLPGQIRSSWKETWRKICPSDTLYTTNPTRTGVGMKPSLRCDRPATSSLSHETVHFVIET